MIRDFSSSFFELFLIAISIKIGQVPHSQKSNNTAVKFGRLNIITILTTDRNAFSANMPFLFLKKMISYIILLVKFFNSILLLNSIQLNRGNMSSISPNLMGLGNQKFAPFLQLENKLISQMIIKQVT